MSADSVDELANSAFREWVRATRELHALERAALDATRQGLPISPQMVGEIELARVVAKDRMQLAADAMRAQGDVK